MAPTTDMATLNSGAVLLTLVDVIKTQNGVRQGSLCYPLSSLIFAWIPWFPSSKVQACKLWAKPFYSFTQLMWPFVPEAGGPWRSTQGFAIRKQKSRYSEVPIKTTVWLMDNDIIEQVKCFKYLSFEKQQHLCRSCYCFKIPWSQEEGSVPVVLQVFHTKYGPLFQVVSYKKGGGFGDLVVSPVAITSMGKICLAPILKYKSSWRTCLTTKFA